MKRIFCIFLLLLLLLLTMIACDRGTNGSSENDTTAHVHHYDVQVVPPSCTDGYTIYTCRDCGHSYTDVYVDAVGHQFDASLIDAPCDQNQSYKYVCSVCAFSYTEESALRGTRHDLKKLQTVAPTRTEGGYTLYGCSKCDHTEQADLTSPTSFSVGLTYKKDGDGYYVTGIGTCRDTDLVIPSVNEHGKNVIGINDSAFSNCAQLTSIQIPDSVRHIRHYAFSRCTGLTSLKIPKNAYVEEHALLGCTNLVELTMPIDHPLRLYFSESTHSLVPPALKTLHVVGHASSISWLSETTTLKTVTLGEEIKSIPAQFFKNCTGLTSISYSDSITSIGEQAFYGTTIKEFTLPLGVTVLPAQIFSDCTSLHTVTLHDKLTKIEEYAFYSCTSIRSIDLPSSLNKIEQYAFANSGLQRIKIPERVVKLPVAVFLSCQNLSQIELHDNIVSIENDAFRGTAITSFTYPKKLSSPLYALRSCKNLTKIEYNEYVKVVGGLEGCISLTEIHIPDGVTMIDSQTFQGCTKLTTVTIPESVSEIGECAFEDCTALRSISIPSKVTVLSDRIFKGCTALESVSLPDTVTKLGLQAFYNCSALNLSKLPSSLETIGQWAFEGSGLTSVVLPASVTAIGSAAFQRCDKLERVTVEKTVSDNCFKKCANLREVTLLEGVTYIPRYAFADCASLETLRLPASLRTIDDYAFQNCTSLPELTIPDGITEIDSSAFQNCTSLKKLVLNAKNLSACKGFSGIETLIVGDGVERIPTGLAAYNAYLREVQLPNTLKVVGSSAFSHCTALERINLPASLELIESEAFRDTALTELTFQGDRVEIGYAAFVDCKELAAIDFGNACVTMNGAAFAGCDTLEDLKNSDRVRISAQNDLPERFYRTENCLILCCSTLIGIDAENIDSAVTVPEGIRYISANAFQSCNIIKSVSLPTTLREVGDHAFAGCTRLRSIEFPNGVEKIGVSVLEGCTALTEIIFSDALEQIPSKAYNNCTSLSHISFGTSLRSVAPDAYTYSNWNIGQRNLYTATYRGAAAEWAEVELGENNVLSSCTIICNDRTIVNLLYQSGIYNSDCTYKVFSDQTLVLYGEGYFPLNFSVYNPDHFRRVKKMVISEGITSVNHEGFDIFSDLEEIEFASTLVTFPIDRLSGSPWYQNHDPYGEDGLFIVGSTLYDVSTDLEGALTLPSGLTVIGGHAFANCAKLTEVHVPTGVTELGTQAFSGCAVLRTVTLPEGLRTIGGSAFSECTVLENVALPQSLTSIGSSLFFSCDAITEIVIPKNVAYMESVATHCDNLQRVVFLGATKLGYSGIRYCDALEYVYLGEGMNDLPEHTVYSCASLKAIVIPDSVTSLNKDSFSVSRNVFLCFLSSKNAEAVIEAVKSNVSFTAFLYSETPPTEAGNWWHFDENGIPVAYE